MATAFNVALQVVLVGSVLLFAWTMIQLVIQERDPTEKLMRTIALVAGAVVALGAQASGHGFADFAVNSLAGARPAGGAAAFAATVIPGGAGALLGWYFNRTFRRSAAKGLRWVVFFGMLTAVAFAEIYAKAVQVNGVMIGKAAIPNASFVAGIVLTMLIVVDGPEGAKGRGRGLAAVGDLLRGRSGTKVPHVVSERAATEAHPTRNNPFARD